MSKRCMRSKLSKSKKIAAQIAADLIAGGYSPTSDLVYDLDGAAVVVDGDCCLVLSGERADFYFRAPLVGGPRWGYRHSYGAPLRPSDARRYLRHGREAMRRDGWEV